MDNPASSFNHAWIIWIMAATLCWWSFSRREKLSVQAFKSAATISNPAPWRVIIWPQNGSRFQISENASDDS